MKRLALLSFLFLFIGTSAIACDFGDWQCMEKHNQESNERVYQKYGVDISKQVYGDTTPEHLEYDIVHKDGTKEHCYQVMEGHSVTCN